MSKKTVRKPSSLDLFLAFLRRPVGQGIIAFLVGALVYIGMMLLISPLWAAIVLRHIISPQAIPHISNSAGFMLSLIISAIPIILAAATAASALIMVMYWLSVKLTWNASLRAVGFAMIFCLLAELLNSYLASYGYTAGVSSFVNLVIAVVAGIPFVFAWFLVAVPTGHSSCKA